MKSMKKILLTSFLLLFLGWGQVQAAGLVPCGGSGEPPCQFCHFFVMINDIIKFVMSTLVPAIAVLMLVIGGIMFFFAGAKPEILIRAKGVVTSTVIGLLIVFCAWIIVNTILTKTGVVQSPALLQWYNIECSTQ
jgi:type IV secretory pathway VirB2 component (pilin)